MRLFLAALTVLVALPVQAGALTMIRVDYTAWTSRGTSDWTIRAELKDDGSIEESTDGRAGSQRAKGKTGQRLGARWRVIAENKLQRVYEYPNHFLLTDVEVDGKSCRATVTTQLKPGKTDYLVTGVNAGLFTTRRPEYMNVRCAIE